LLSLAGILLCVTFAVADVPYLINYQGIVTDTDGTPITGIHDLTFSIYADSLPIRPPMWTEVHTGVAIDDGLFNVILGHTTPIPAVLFNYENRWMGITVDTDEEMAPRMRITSVPWSLRAAIADSAVTSGSGAGDGHSLDAADGDPTDAVYVNNEGEVGIGTTTPETHLHIDGSPVAARGQLSISAPLTEDVFLSFYEGGNFKAYLWYDDSDDDLRLQNVNEFAGGDLCLNPYGGNVGIGTDTPGEQLEVVGTIHSTTGGFRFPDGTLQTTADTGEEGLTLPYVGTTSTGGNAFEISNTGSGRGIFSSASGVSGQGVRGEATDTGSGTNIGGYFVAAGGSGRGIYAEATNAGDVSNYGGYFKSAGKSGTAVLGHATASGIDDISNIGGRFQADGKYGIGVMGATGSSGDGARYGGYFVANWGDEAVGVYGKGFGIGVKGESNNVAVYAEATHSHGTGLLAKGGSSAFAADLWGKVMIRELSTGNPVMELGAGLDYSEGFDVSENKVISPGSVLIIDPENPGKLTLSAEPYDSKVAGIVAGAKGLGSGVRLGVDQFDHDVALAGRVYCNVDATEMGIEPGDLLTTSDIPGYAMKATDYARAQGAILGKAMEGLERGKKGQILVLVTLQ